MSFLNTAMVCAVIYVCTDAIMLDGRNVGRYHSTTISAIRRYAASRAAWRVLRRSWTDYGASNPDIASD